MRNARIASILTSGRWWSMAVLFGIEAAVAPSLQHVMTITKVAAFGLGVLGLAFAVAVLVRRSAAATRGPLGRRAPSA
jgi:hypothetical protein